MTRVLSSDDLAALTADEVCSLWERVNSIKAVRALDPQLREGILARVAEALADGRLSKAGAREIRDQLDRTHPAAVLGAHWQSLLPDRPALGAYLIQRSAAE